MGELTGDPFNIERGVFKTTRRVMVTCFFGSCVTTVMSLVDDDDDD